MQNITLFDLDHTLLPLDSDYSWGEFTTQIGWTDPVEFKDRNDEFFAQYKKGELKISEYVRFATQAIKDQGAAKSIAAHADFMKTVIQPAIKQAATDLIAKHRAAGDQLVIVTATNEFVTRPIATALGIDELIAVAAWKKTNLWAARAGSRVKSRAFPQRMKAKSPVWKRG